jgi:hypothetical protein
LTECPGLRGPSFFTSSCCPTSSARTRSAISAASRKTRTLAELLIDSEEDRYVRALLVGVLRERERGEWRD